MNGQTEYTYDLFISHAKVDHAWVKGFLLPALGLPPERIITQQGFRPGAPIVTEFERAVTGSRCIVLVLTPAYLADEWSTFGETLASHAGVVEQRDRLVPLLLRPCTLPMYIDFRMRLDCTDEANWKDEIARLRALLNQPAPKLERIACPYPGMVTFHAEDARFFYGRDPEIQQMLQHLRHQRLLFIIGPSGSGKSSLVFAGLLPKLLQSTYFAEGFWLVREMRPGVQPLKTLGQILEGDPRQFAQALAELLAANPPAQRLLLVIDQFEEFFTQAGRAEQSCFISTMRTIRTVENCVLLVVMRSDFYTDLMNSALWPVEPSQRLEIAPLRGVALRQAIQQPAADLGVYIEAGLIERLLADAAEEPGVLPLMQEMMVLLWGEMRHRLLPLSAYEQLGGKGRSGLAAAVSRKADATLAELSVVQKAIARRIFLRLVQFGEGRPDTRRQQPVADLSATGDDPLLFEHTLHHLTDNRLLTLTGEEALVGKKADIAHEALITGWPTLQEWLGERRDAELSRRRLEAKATEWVRLGQGSRGLLDKAELSEARRWLDSPDAEFLGRSEALPALVETSHVAHRRSSFLRFGTLGVIITLLVAVLVAIIVGQNSVAIQERKAAMTAEADRIAQITLAAESEGRRLEAVDANRTTQVEIVVRSTAEANAREKEQLALTRAAEAARANKTAIVALEAEVSARETAVASEAEAKQQARLSLSGQLAAQSLSYLDKQFDLALLLSIEAYDTADTVRSRSSLLTALENPFRQVRSIHGLTFSTWSVAFSPDGKILASGLQDNTIRLWDVATGQPIGQPLDGGAYYAVYSVAFSPDGKILASGSCGEYDEESGECALGEIRLWDVATGQLIGQPLIAHTVAAYSVAFSPDGKILASGSCSKGGERSCTFGEVRLWDVATGQPIGEPLTNHAGTVNSVAFSPDGRILASGGAGPVLLWDITAGQPISQSIDGLSGAFLAFSPDGKYLASGGWGRSIRLWDVAKDQPIGQPIEGHAGSVASVAFSPDGRILASGSWDDTIRLWDVTTGQPIGQPLTGHTDLVRSVAFSPDGRTLASGGNDSSIRLWNVVTDQLIDTPLTGHTGIVFGVNFSPDGKILASCSRDSSVRLWDVTTGQLIGEPLTGHVNDVYSMAFSPDGKILASGGCGESEDEWSCNSGEIRLWDVTTGQLIGQSLTGHGDFVHSVAFSPDGKTLISCGYDDTVRLWDVSSLLGAETVIDQPIDQTAISHVAHWAPVAFSPDGETLALNLGRNILLWDVVTSQHNGQIFTGHIDRVLSMDFSPDSRTLASGSVDTTVRLWDVATGQLIGQPLIGHIGQVLGVTFSPDDKMLATGSWDGTIRLWDLDTGQPFGQPLSRPSENIIPLAELQDSGVFSLSFGPDGRTLASGQWDGIIRLWDLDPASWRTRACHIVGRNLIRAEWNLFLPGQPYHKTCEQWPLEGE